MKSSLKKLKVEYEALVPIANRFLDELLRQFKELLTENKIPLAAPIECRLKLWSSIEEKLKRKAWKLQSVKDLNDLIGVRLILLFKRDVERASQLLTAYFFVLKKEDAAKKLTEDQFGYTSLHYIIELPEKWLAVPSFRSMKGLRAEIQVRTMAQHIWASASHVLQYKQEIGVPMPLRRAVHRVSALLETVDLEFDRVLIEKENYKESLDTEDGSESLDVVSLEKILDSILPPENRDYSEDYAEVLEYLGRHYKITTQSQVRQLLFKNLKAIIADDKEMVKAKRKDNFKACRDVDERERAERGIFYNHQGLTVLATDLDSDLIYIP
jgi:putative GTP pyrophosphokinase